MTTSSAGIIGTKHRKATSPSARNAANTNRRSSGCAAGATKKMPPYPQRNPNSGNRTESQRHRNSGSRVESQRRSSRTESQQQSQKRQPDREPAQRQKSNTRRPYDHDDGEDDQKAKDKRYWFNRQDNGVCNYCGNRYHYDQLEMEHMIPKELGGPDHRRNMQLACKPCNEKKGTSTDIEFRQLNAKLIPLEERTPAARPVAPRKDEARHPRPTLPGPE